jgi:hypothetical protein
MTIITQTFKIVKHYAKRKKEGPQDGYSQAQEETT